MATDVKSIATIGDCPRQSTNVVVRFEHGGWQVQLRCFIRRRQPCWPCANDEYFCHRDDADLICTLLLSRRSVTHRYFSTLQGHGLARHKHGTHGHRLRLEQEDALPWLSPFSRMNRCAGSPGTPESRSSRSWGRWFMQRTPGLPDGMAQGPQDVGFRGINNLLAPETHLDNDGGVPW